MKHSEEIHYTQETLPSTLEGEYIRCTFDQALFEESDYRNIHFVECTFNHCNFHLVKWDGARLQDVHFNDCKIVGGQFHLCEKRFFSPHFERSILMSCNFSEMKMKKTTFAECHLTECFFNHTDLSEANFTKANLEGTLFHHTLLAKADFREAINYRIDPKNNPVTKAKFSLPEATNLLQSFEIELC